MHNIVSWTYLVHNSGHMSILLNNQSGKHEASYLSMCLNNQRPINNIGLL
jgi:hypothetical protein